MYWEPENEIKSDDIDSEYYVTEDSSTCGDQGNLSYNSSGDPECSSGDGAVEDFEIDGFRRSKGNKQKANIEIMTSSGRHVKRRNLDESNGNAISTKIRKSKNGRKDLKRKSSKSISFRPQRAAARNALNLFSKITRTSTDMEDNNVFEGEPESESTQPGSVMDSDGSDIELTKRISRKEISLAESENLLERVI